VISLAIFMLALIFCTAMGVVVGYHRMLTHRAVTFVRPLEIFLVLCGLGAGTPVQWVGNHRFHHAHTDTPDDCHSPKYRGFWVAHCGWYLGTSSTLLCALYACAGPVRTIFDALWRPRSNQQHLSLAKDVAADPLYRWLSKPGPYALVLLGYVTALWLFAFLAWGAFGLAAMTLVHLVAYTFGDLVNSVGHLKGARTFDTGDESRDNALVSLLAFGDGWHNSHHAFPGSIRSGLTPGQFDPAYRFAKICERLGLASGLREPAPSDLASRRIAS
jgi:stearoyl-CoA desaturase (delta-9 desaturase)